MRAVLGPWAPDGPKIGRPGLRVARNVVPAADSYEPWRMPVETTQEIGARPFGAPFGARDKAGAVHIYAGTATGLFEAASDGSWTDRSGAAYTLTDTSRWRFATFGDRVLATSFTDPIQYQDMSAGGAFADLPGSPPKAKFIASYGEFVVLGNLDDSALKVRWSAIGDSESWTIGVNQADEQELPDGGQITGLIVGDVVYILQEYAIRRMVYVGPPEIMRIDVIEPARGCASPESVVSLGSRAFYRGQDGFYMLDTVAGQSTPIGHEQVDEWFDASLERSNAHRITAAVDPLHKLVMWLYPSVDSASGAPDRTIIYNWSVGRWAYADLDLEALAPVLTLSTTLESLDALYGDLDSIPISLDDPSLIGGVVAMGGVTGDGALVRFSGAGTVAEATFETDDIIGQPNQVFMARGVRPLICGADAYAAVKTRMKSGDGWTLSDEAPAQVTGVCPLRAVGRHLRVIIRVPEGSVWSDAEGYEIDLTAVEGR